MKLPLSWLKEFLETDADLFTLTDALTHLGHEVESVDNPAATLKPFVVAEILEATPHPEADRLRVCKVATSEGELQIVCGAPNARAGIKVALARIGSIIPTNQMEIKKSKIRGVESQGMLCSARELGIGQDHEGIMELPLDAPIGAAIIDILGLNDPIIDVAITANRGDSMSIYGIARDLAAKGIGRLKALPSPAITSTEACVQSVALEDASLCPAFIGRVIKGVHNIASPEWLQQRLKSVGLRPISALVDITNYMTIAYGRPLHVYDMAKLKGTIHVRATKTNETLDALNDKSYVLRDGMCAITDDSGVIGLGGIVGGVSTGVDEHTINVFLECAYFTPAQIGKTGRALMIDSDARTRFERGIDPNFMPQAADIATQMILDLCGGTASQIQLTGTLPSHTRHIPWNPQSVNQLGGTNLSRESMEKTLVALGFVVSGAHVTSPSWRLDIEQPADIAEEVLRLHGYDAIPPQSLPKPDKLPQRALNDTQLKLSRTRTCLAAQGIHESHSWGFISPFDAEHFIAQSKELELRNPISSDLSLMRTSCLPHLLRAVAKNQSRGMTDVHLFEVGAVFVVDKPLMQENVASIIRTGKRMPAHWQGTRDADIYTVKADIDALLKIYGLDSAKLILKTDTLPPYLHPGRSASLWLGPKNCLGVFGELHPSVAQSYDAQNRIIIAEIYLDRIPPAKPSKNRALKISDFQPVTRDFAFVVDAHLPASDLIKALQNTEKLLLRHIVLFDVYSGKGVADDKKSLALSVTLQADDRTLTDKEIETVSQSLIKAAQSVGASLR